MARRRAQQNQNTGDWSSPIVLGCFGLAAGFLMAKLLTDPHLSLPAWWSQQATTFQPLF